MASIKRRKDKYCVIYNYTDINGKRKQKWETYATKAEAQKRKKEVEYKEKRGTFVIPQCKTLKDLLREYVDLYGKDKWAISTYESNVSLIRNYILPLIGDEKLVEINTRFLEKYYQQLLQTPAVPTLTSQKSKDEKVGTSTIRDIHKLLRSCFEQAVKWELLERNPAVHATVPKHKASKRDIWTAETFLDYINGRITEYYPNSSIYLQTREGVLTYLNLWDPDHNYRYKPAPANNWASYIGFGDWESGQRFSLRKYYKMCDEIQEVVKGHEELLRVHRQRFENGELDYDKEYHILTFDVLYCFWGYEDARREALEEYQEAMKLQRIDDLEEQLSDVCRQIETKTGQLSSPECLGCRFGHKKFGSGVVKEIDGTRLVVLFDEVGSKLFKYPDAFVNGFLQPEDSSIMEQFERNSISERELAALREQEEKLREELASVDKPE